MNNQLRLIMVPCQAGFVRTISLCVNAGKKENSKYKKQKDFKMALVCMPGHDLSVIWAVLHNRLHSNNKAKHNFFSKKIT